jgi:uncharacterized membrane protein
MHPAFVFLVIFFAAAVEAVEALTIVLAVGVTRNWSSALKGTAVALIALAAFVAVLGPALTAIPLGALRLVLGGLLLIFGLQWLRKAVLRASGLKALHDEDAIYKKEMAEARSVGSVNKRGTDRYAFRVAFMGVFLEGLEVAFIVVTLGSTEHDIPIAILGAVAAAVAVVAVGLVVHRPLSRVPENSLKYAVGIMLTSFGTLWAAEGAGVKWPGHDLAVFPIIASMLVVSIFAAGWLRRQSRSTLVVEPVPRPD